MVGFDDVQSAAFQNPGLTTVRQPLHAMGVLAAQTVLERIGEAGGSVRSRQIVVDPELVVRESTARVAVPARGAAGVAEGAVA